MTNLISKSAFKPQALKFFRQIQEDGRELIITDHSRPVIRIIPFREEPDVIIKALRNSVIRYDDPFEAVGQDDWEILK